MDTSGLDASAAAFNRTVDALSEEELAQPSLLPGWTRAHVVAHVALNGEALSGVLEAVQHGDPVAMYRSDEQRDADIEALASAPSSELREKLLTATTQFSDSLATMQDDHWDATFSRTPGAEPVPVAAAPAMRWRELEIHHADLGTAYTHQDWPETFAADLVDGVVADQSAAGPFVVRATDVGRDWSVGGDGGPVVSGTAAALGWWLTGRGAGEGLSPDGGPLPTLGAWRRASATTAPTPET